MNIDTSLIKPGVSFSHTVTRAFRQRLHCVVIMMNQNNRQQNRKINVFAQPKVMAVMACIYFIIILGCDYLSEMITKNTGHVVNSHIVTPFIIALVSGLAWKVLAGKKA